MPYKDRDKQRACQNKWAKDTGAVKKRRQKIRDFIENIKNSSCCQICKETASETFDFHHKAATDKKFGISNAARHSFSLETVQSEIDKCVLLCANCHRRIHSAIDMVNKNKDLVCELLGL